MNLKALKAEIVKNGLTISQLADMIDLERKTLYHRMNGSIPFKLHEVVAIAKILKLSDDDIIRIFLKDEETEGKEDTPWPTSSSSQSRTKSATASTRGQSR